MDEFERLNSQGAELLAELERDSNSDCWRQFDALFYELVWRYLKSHHDVLAARVAGYLRVDDVVAPPILASEVDEVSHDATIVALRRVRGNAARFDPARGTLVMWVIGAAEYAYIEVVKAIASARRSDRLEFVPPEALLAAADPSPTTDEFVLAQINDADALADAANHVSEKEFIALRLVVTAGYSYAEAAEKIFADRGMTKQVDGLLTRGKRKLAAAWSDRRPSGSASGTNVRDSADDKEIADE